MRAYNGREDRGSEALGTAYNSKKGLFWVLAGLVVLVAGCEGVDPERGYTSASLYREGVETVYVEMFESQTFRREIEFDVTRALVERLELHTPYRLAGDRRTADTVLTGTVLAVGEGTQAGQRELDRPVVSEVTVVATFSWKDLRTGEYYIENQRVRTSADYAILLGASRRTAAREAANELAVRIVEEMEEPW